MAHAEALPLIKIGEDKQCLIAQRGKTQTINDISGQELAEEREAKEDRDGIQAS